MRRKEALTAILCLLPAAFLGGVLIFYPILRTLELAFFHMDPVGRPTGFAGWTNFTNLLKDPLFSRVILNTLIWTAGVVIITMVLGMAVALLLNSRPPGHRIARLLLLLPWASSLTISAITWRWMLNGQYGAINQLLHSLHLMPVTTQPEWLALPRPAFEWIIVVGIWASVPFTAIVLQAGLQSIPSDIHEAGWLDGASGWKHLRYLTLPMMKSVVVTVGLLNTIYVFNSFPIIWIMTRGGPMDQTHIMITYLYKQAFTLSEYSSAGAIATLTFIILLAISVIILRLSFGRGSLASGEERA